MGNKKIIRHGVLYPYCCNEVEPEQGQVGKVVPVQGFVLQVCMDKPQPAQSAPAKRIIRQFCDEYALCVSGYDMNNLAGPIDQQTYLPVDL